MKKNYMLVAQLDDQILEIDWTKITLFESLKKEKYKLHKIDFFTSHYKNQDLLKTILLDNGILTIHQFSKAKLAIMPFTREETTIIVNGKTKKKKNISYSENELDGGLVYKKSQKYLLDDYHIIHLLYSLLDDFEFIKRLYDFYIVNGKYNKQNINTLQSQISQIEEKIKQGKSNLNGLRLGLIIQRDQLNESNFLLTSIYSYSQAKTEKKPLTLSQKNLAEANIEEFFNREKYYVIGCKQGTYERRVLSFKLDQKKQRCINQLQFHTLITFIQNYLQELEAKNNLEKFEYPKQKKIRSKF